MLEFSTFRGRLAGAIENSLGLAEIALLIGGGFAAGIVNTMAGGGSLLTVPLLVAVGLPGTLANGTNRLGLVFQNLIAAWRFRAEGVSELRRAVPILAPVVAGSALGAVAISRVDDATFEKLFGFLMLALLVPTLRRRAKPAAGASAGRPWSRLTTTLVFFGIGVYSGSVQAGSGIFLLFALSHSGLDLVRANAVKVVVIAATTIVAVPVFAQAGQIAWIPGLILACGFAAGAALGATLAVRGGEALIRPVMALCVIALAARMLGLYGS
jgi:uncharacterized membrane protein YfcA